jgi:hypothetical protein
MNTLCFGEHLNSNFLERRFCTFGIRHSTNELLQILRNSIDQDLHLLKFLMSDSVVKFRENQHIFNQQEAEQVLDEYTKFMFLKIQENDFDATKLSPSQLIDEVWHYHISMPKRYCDFNKKIFGLMNNFIDHNPEGSKNQIAREQRFQNTINAYQRYFGESIYNKAFIWDLETITLTPEDIERRKTPNRRNTMLKIKTMTGKEVIVLVDLHEFGDYVEDLKTIIRDSDKVPIDQQRLIFGGKQLENCRKLCSYEKLTEGSTLHFVLRLSGC